MRRLIILILIVASLSSAEAAAQTNYDFVSVFAQSATLSSGFSAGYPMVNNSGVVAFAVVSFSQTAGGFVWTILKSTNGGPPVPFFSLGQLYPYSLAINDAGAVAAMVQAGDTDGAGPEITRFYVIRIDPSGSAATILAEADASGPNPYVEFGTVSLNNAGQVAVTARRNDARSQSVLRLDDSGAVEIARSSDDFCCFSNPTINDAGVVAFKAGGSPQDIFTGSGGPLTNEGVAVPCNGSSGYSPIINNVGFVMGDCGAPPLFAVRGGVVNILVAGTEDRIFGVLSSGGYSFNNNGQPAFLTAPSSFPMDQGLFTGNDPVGNKVLRLGDVVLGGTTEEIRMGQQSLNDAGQIVFLLQLNSGPATEAHVVLATPRRAPQTISFPGLADRTFSDPPFSVSATASSGLPVTFAASGACSLAGDTVMLLGAGSCTVTASQAGNATYLPAPSIAQTFVIRPAPQTITFAPLPDRAFGDPPFQVTATASSGLPVFLYAAGPCSISSGTLFILGGGSCTVTAIQPGNADYAAAHDVVRIFTVAQAGQSIVFAALPDRAFVDSPFGVFATASSNLSVSFAAAGSCTVAGSLVSLTGVGACTVTASQPGNADYAPAPDVARTFAVTRADQSIVFAALADRTFGDSAFTVDATASSGLVVSFAAAGSCTVAGNLVSLTGAGTCTVTASQAGNASYAPAPDVARTLAIAQASQSIAFAPLPDRVLGDSLFTVTATASSGLAVEFAASGNCTIAGNRVSLTGAGSCTVTASQPGNASYAPAAAVARTFSISNETALADTWSGVSPMVEARESHAATLLADGRVLVTGGSPQGNATSLAGAELYDPIAEVWHSAGAMAVARRRHTSTRLLDGRVLVAGGADPLGFPLASAEMFDPATGVWTPAAPMLFGRTDHTATLLPDGRVLMVGGNAFGATTSAQLYDPSSDTWAAAAPLTQARESHTATLLPDGHVLVAGGVADASTLASVEIYDVAGNSWAGATPMRDDRANHTATLLANGTVLVTGGRTAPVTTRASAESYDPATNLWSPAGTLGQARMSHTATLLTDSRVLVIGGLAPSGLGGVEVYSPATNGWSPAANPNQRRLLHTATRLANGRVLVAGGSASGPAFNSVEVYGKAPQSLSFDPLPDRTAVDLPFTVTASASSGLAVSFTATGTCTVSGNTVTITGPGLCTVTARQAGSAEFTPAPPVARSFNIVNPLFPLVVTLTGTGVGAVTSVPSGIACPGDCSESYLNGVIVTLTAAPAAGSLFGGWSGACTAASGPCSVTMGAASAVTATFLPNDQDLVTTMVSDPPVAALPGSSFAVTDTVRNQGGVSAATSRVRYYLSADGQLDTSDIRLSGNRIVPALAAGASSQGTVTVTIPTATPQGIYRLLACADDLAVITESDETNNCRASSSTIQVGRPDLAELGVSDPPTAALPGSTFSVTDTAWNRGPLAAAATTTRYYLSVDPVRDTGDRLLPGSRAVDALGPEATSTGAATVTIPAGMPLGTYFLLACADDAAPRVTEANEANNCVASAGTVQVTLPDLVQTAIGAPPATARRGNTFALSDTVANNSVLPAPATTTRYYLSVDQVQDTGDRRLASVRAVPALGPGEQSTGTVTLTVPNNMAFGTYFLIACADDLAPRVAERDETNNCRASATTMQVVP